jgi:hypothetical protein
MSTLDVTVVWLMYGAGFMIEQKRWWLEKIAVMGL